MTYGLTPTGFVKKRLEDIKLELDTSFREKLGNGINLLPSSVLGQMIGIYAEREALLWDLTEAVYNSQYPDTATGISLDNAVRLTNITRLAAQRSTVSLRVFGTIGTAVNSGFRVSVVGAPANIFETIQSGTVGNGINAKIKIDFSATPTSGSFSLVFDGQTTSPINYNDTLATIKGKVEALSNIASVTVTGAVSTSGLFIEFTGVDGQRAWNLPTVVTNTLASPSATISISYDTVGFAPFCDVNAQAITTGPIQGLTGTITVIETPIFNITSVTNLEDAVLGSDIETDSELRTRRLNLLQRQGTTTVDGIRAALLGVDDVTHAIIIENVETTIDSDGRPPKSYECFVQGGDTADIAATIWASKPAGIKTVGDISASTPDSQGTLQSVAFSRPTEVDIYIIVNITYNNIANNGPVYPSNGNDLVLAALLEYGDALEIGQDVINNQLYTPINTIPGVIGIEILQGTSPVPATSNNITIASTALAVFDSSRITINSST